MRPTSLYSRCTQDPERVGQYYALRFACPVNEIAYNLFHGVTELSITAVLTTEGYFFGLQSTNI